MTKKDLVDATTKRTKLKKQDVEEVIDNMIEVIILAIASNEALYLRGFGTFTAKERNARKARNVKAGTIIKLDATAVPHFKPSKEFKTLVSKNYNTRIY